VPDGHAPFRRNLMSLTLRSGLSWCVCAGQAVFLDLTSNRYFCLPEVPDGLFRRWAAGEILAPDELAPLLDCGVIKTEDEAVLRRVAGAYVTSAMLLRADDQCLPRAIAARRLCQRLGQQAALIFGVRLEPFAAHSWVQCGDAVIVGELENVRLYTPILVLP